MDNEEFVRALVRDRESREFHAREETLRDILAEHERDTCGVPELHRIHAARRRTVDLIEEVYRTPTRDIVERLRDQGTRFGYVPGQLPHDEYSAIGQDMHEAAREIVRLRSAPGETEALREALEEIGLHVFHLSHGTGEFDDGNGWYASASGKVDGRLISHAARGVTASEAMSNLRALSTHVGDEG